MLIISRALEHYLILLHNTRIARFEGKHNREDYLTDQMDQLWYELTPEQQKVAKEHKKTHIDPLTLKSGHMRSRPPYFSRSLLKQVEHV